MYALIDSNNFFVSCERLFRPDLATKPVVVLSSNDGCAISRSSEAKVLGVKMGEPVFKLRNRFTVINACHSERSRGISSYPITDETLRQAQGSRKPDLVVFSANLELYGDISERIATLLTSITPHIELYSIDESFLDLSELDIRDYSQWGNCIRSMILKNIGIPVSIGIAPSKTLCKTANHWAKKHAEYSGVVAAIQQNRAWHDILVGSPVNDVWGVGWKLAPRLRAEGVFTALDLARMNPRRAQQLMGIHGRHMVYELNGTRCLPLQPATKPQKMIGRGRQFGEDTSDFHVIEAAVTTLAGRAAHELRREGQLAARAAVILRTNRLKPGYTRTFDEVRFYTPTADVGIICSQLIRTLQRTFRSNLLYHKADVILYELSLDKTLQTDAFGAVDLTAHARSQTLMQAYDAVNSKYGSHTLRPAAELLSQAWKPRSNMLSPRYTSSWSDLPHII